LAFFEPTQLRALANGSDLMLGRGAGRASPEGNRDQSMYGWWLPAKQLLSWVNLRPDLAFPYQAL
jgi:hypothetical protein